MLTKRRPPPGTSREERLVALMNPTVQPVTRAVMATPASLAGARPLAPQHKPPRDELRPATKTEAEEVYMGRVAALGCIVCRLLGNGPTPAQVHHLREGQGGAQRAGNYCTVPLCEPHHTGPAGIHGDRSAMRLLKVDEMDLLNITIGELQ